jgi:ABC-type glycerol-3-phosphate transport system permease component
MKKVKISPLNITIFAVLSLYVVSMVVLLGWGFLTSFKSQSEFRLNIMGLPKEWVWNYTTVFEKFQYPVTDETGRRYVDVFGMLGNTILYAGGCAVTQTMTPCLVAYCCARYRYKLSEVIPYVVITVMTLSIAGSLPSEIQMARLFGLYDQIWGLWIMKCNFLGMYFLVFFASFQSLPKDFAEAARMDGASNFRILFQISLPMVRNTFFVVLLLKFIDFWNDYQTPMIYLRSFPTAALGIYSFSFSYGTQSSWPPMKITGSMILLLPVLIVFLCFHDKMIGNVSMGGIKE